MPSNLNRRFTMLDLTTKLHKALDQYVLVDLKYQDLKVKRALAKRRGRTALYNSLSLQRQCFREVRLAYRTYVLHTIAKMIQVVDIPEDVRELLVLTVPPMRPALAELH